MRRDKNGIRLIALLTVLIILIACAVKLDSRLRVLLNNYGQSRAAIVSNSVINQTVYDYLEQNKLQYTDLIKINTDAANKVTSVEFDTVEMTKLKAGIIGKVQENINKKKTVVLSVPVGTLTGNQLLNNRGPRINIELAISSAVYSKISSKFISAGINQTLHQITLSISTDIFFVMPWYRTSGKFETEFILAETVIVGEVPDAYTNVIEYPGSNIAGEIFDYSAEY